MWSKDVLRGLTKLLVKEDFGGAKVFKQFPLVELLQLQHAVIVFKNNNKMFSWIPLVPTFFITMLSSSFKLDHQLLGYTPARYVSQLTSVNFCMYRSLVNYMGMIVGTERGMGSEAACLTGEGM